MSTNEETKITKKLMLVGKVISNKMEKTIIVSVDRLYKHPVVKKYIKRTSKYAVHDEKNSAKIGDVVQIMESRPISKTKRWMLDSVVTKTESK
ncbi:MAG: hypothetical protein ACD_37C00267G0003 [uncultured bacterium]|nr:MAG: hypothetical protein ACD_37C00267G0003 [uncultured bacterium]